MWENLQNLKCEKKTQNVITQKLQMSNSKTENLTKLKHSKGHKTQISKGDRSKKMTKLKKSKWDKNQN